MTCTADVREITPVAKACSKCGDVKPIAQFHRNGNGLRPDCRACARAYGFIARGRNADAYNAQKRTHYKTISQTPEVRVRSRRDHLRKKYGIDQADYDRKLAEQRGLCAICGKPPVGRKPLSVDHNHTTGQVRGLLCTSCNTALGMFGESVDVLTAASAYVIAWEATEGSEDLSATT